MNDVNKITEEVAFKATPPIDGGMSLQREDGASLEYAEDTSPKDLVVNDILSHVMPPLSPMEEMLLEKSIDEKGCQESIKVFKLDIILQKQCHAVRQSPCRDL